MLGNNPQSLDIIANDPEFNFITKLQNKNNTFCFDQYDNFEISHDLGSSCKYFDEETFVEKFGNNNNFSVMSLNIQSLPSKFGQLSELLDNFKKHKYLPSSFASRKCGSYRIIPCLT